MEVSMEMQCPAAKSAFKAHQPGSCQNVKAD